MIFLILYIVGAVVSWPVLGYLIAKDTTYQSFDMEDIVFGLLLGGFMALLWPIVISGYGLARLIKWATDGGFDNFTAKLKDRK